MKPTHGSHLGFAFGLVVLASSQAWSGELVRGRVVDIGLPEQTNGIGGVTIVISDVTTLKPVGDGTTDATGSYQIEVNASRSAKLVATFSKIGYFARPTYQAVASSVPYQPSVKLSKENAPEGYYKAAADNIWTIYKESPMASATSFSAVTALPASSKETVFTALKLKDAGVYQGFKEADQTYQATQEFLTKYKPLGVNGDKAFGAYANYGNTGTVWLYGSVPNADSKREYEKAIKNFTAVREVKNDLTILK